jgi:hypothetical protein
MKPITDRLFVAGLAGALGIVSACSNGSNSVMQDGTGAVQIVMSASAAAPLVATATGGSGSDSSGDHNLQAANVTFASILARNLDGELINVTIELPVTVDLLGLVSGGSFMLPAGFLPPGTYDQLVIVMTELQVTLANGTIVTIDPPGGGWTAVIAVTEPFTVVEGQTTNVTIRFRPDRSFQWLEDRWQFHPSFDCNGGDDDDDDEDDD